MECVNGGSKRDWEDIKRQKSGLQRHVITRKEICDPVLALGKVTTGPTVLPKRLPNKKVFCAWPFCIRQDPRDPSHDMVKSRYECGVLVFYLRDGDPAHVNSQQEREAADKSGLKGVNEARKE